MKNGIIGFIAGVLFGAAYLWTQFWVGYNLPNDVGARARALDRCLAVGGQLEGQDRCVAPVPTKAP